VKHERHTAQHDKLLLSAFTLKMLCKNYYVEIIILHLVQPRFSRLNATDTTVMSTKIHLQCKMPV